MYVLEYHCVGSMSIRSWTYRKWIRLLRATNEKFTAVYSVILGISSSIDCTYERKGQRNWIPIGIENWSECVEMDHVYSLKLCEVTMQITMKFMYKIVNSKFKKNRIIRFYLNSLSRIITIIVTDSKFKKIEISILLEFTFQYHVINSIQQ